MDRVVNLFFPFWVRGRIHVFNQEKNTIITQMNNDQGGNLSYKYRERNRKGCTIKCASLSQIKHHKSRAFTHLTPLFVFFCSEISPFWAPYLFNLNSLNHPLNWLWGNPPSLVAAAASLNYYTPIDLIGTLFVHSKALLCCTPSIK